MLLVKGKEEGGQQGQEEEKATRFEFSPPSFAKKKAKKSILSPASQYAVDGLQNLQFAFVNNGGHADSIVTDQNFGKMFDFSILNAKDLKGSWQHMSRRKFTAIQFSSYDESIDKVTSHVAKVQ